LRLLVTGGSGFLGTNVVERLLQEVDVTVLNLDISSPRNKRHLEFWEQVDICDYALVSEKFNDFQPNIVIHMAARTDLDGLTLDDYSVNTVGTENIIRCCNLSESLQRIVFVSSMLVCHLGYQPKNDKDFCPSTSYGESKVRGEGLIRETVRADLEWSILRPTSLWGPWFDIPYKSFFDVVRSGIFMMPSKLKVYRSYGFVLNSVEQIRALIDTDNSHGLYAVHYLADHEPIELSEWASEIIRYSRKGKIFRSPWIVLKIAAKVGDFLKRAGVKSPLLTSSRLRNMTTDAVYDTASWRNIYNDQKYSMSEGVKITVDWMEANEHGDAKPPVFKKFRAS